MNSATTTKKEIAESLIESVARTTKGSMTVARWRAHKKHAVATYAMKLNELRAELQKLVEQVENPDDTLVDDVSYRMNDDVVTLIDGTEINATTLFAIMTPRLGSTYALQILDNGSGLKRTADDFSFAGVVN